MRWEKYGRQLSRITNMFTNSSPTPRPRVFKKFNYRIIWADGGSNQGASKKLSVENYRHGSDACYELMGNLISLNPCGVSGLSTRPLITPHTARGFCHAVRSTAFVRCNYSVL